MSLLLMALLVACQSYPPSDVALDALVSDDRVTVTDDGDLHFEPVSNARRTRVAFYPGGLVEPEAYAPPLRLLAEAGVASTILRMPSNLAVLAPNRADELIDGPSEDWILAGHSLGGSMAAAYTANHPELVDGLAMWAAYPPGGDDLSELALPVLDLTASEDEVLNREAWSEASARLPPDTLRVTIEGGNHAGFGDYGAQDGDGEATITSAEQHVEVVEAMLDLVDQIEGGLR